MLQSLIALDERLFTSLHQWLNVAPSFWQIVAVYGVYLIPLILVWFWFARRREPAIFAFLAGVIAWVGINNLIGHFVIRVRPVDLYHLALPSQEGLFHRPGSSFPSDHTTFMAAIAMIFWLYGERRVAGLITVIGLVTVIGRIVLGLHWPGDILAGIVVGSVTALLLWLIRRPIERWIIQPLVGLARRVGL